MRIETIDLHFQGEPHVIAAFLIRGPAGPVLIEAGPSTTLPALLAGLGEHGVRPEEIRDVMVTHIHLDHAGAAGWWARQGARVWIHSVAAPHLIDPSRLLASATRIYGDRMEMLWGEVLPAPADRVQAVEDGDVIEVGGLQVTAIDTPGHARHHHVYRLDDNAFTGDAAGILLPGDRWIDLPAPPPEFDLEAWKKTLTRLRGLGLQTLYRTHFGPTSDVAAELDRFETVLDRSVGWIGELLGQGLERDAMVTEFSSRMRELALQSGMTEEDALAYELANPRVMSVDGITRYLRKKGPPIPSPRPPGA